MLDIIRLGFYEIDLKYLIAPKIAKPFIENVVLLYRVYVFRSSRINYSCKQKIKLKKLKKTSK